jgi:hypothetical protein
VTEAGIATAALLLLRATAVPPLGAAALRVTEQESVTGPTTELLVQVSALSAGGVAVAVPVPLKPTTAVPLLEELLVTVNWPVAVPDETGLNCTFTLYVPPAAASVIGILLWPLTENDDPDTLRLEI